MIHMRGWWSHQRYSASEIPKVPQYPFPLNQELLQEPVFIKTTSQTLYNEIVKLLFSTFHDINNSFKL